MIIPWPTVFHAEVNRKLIKACTVQYLPAILNITTQYFSRTVKSKQFIIAIGTGMETTRGATTLIPVKHM